MLIGFNLTFGPMHILGLQGQPRRMYTYRDRAGDGSSTSLLEHGRHRSAPSSSPSACCCSSSTSSQQARRKSAAGAARPVGRPQPRVDDPVARPGAQLRRDPEVTRSTSSGTASTRRTKRRAARSRIADGRGDRSPRRGRRRQAHPPAVAVVLADRPGLRPADRRLRPDLQHLLSVVGGLHRPRWRCSAGRSSRRRADDRRLRPAGHRRRRPPSKELADPWLTRRSPRPSRRPPTITDGPRRRHGDRPRRHTHTTTGISNTKLAMWLFLASECLLFGGLISTYMLYRGRHVRAGLGPDQIFDIPFTSVAPFVLLMSSLTMVLAVSAMPARRRPPHQLWLAATALLGATFVGGQVYEFTALLPRGSRLHHQPVLVELLHAHRLPRRPRHRRHHHADVARRHARCGASSPATRPRPSSSSACTGTSSTSSGSSSSPSSTWSRPDMSQRRHHRPTPNTDDRRARRRPRRHACRAPHKEPSRPATTSGSQLILGRAHGARDPVDLRSTSASRSCADAAHADGHQVLHRRPLLHAPAIRQQALQLPVLPRARCWPWCCTCAVLATFHFFDQLSPTEQPRCSPNSPPRTPGGSSRTPRSGCSSVFLIGAYVYMVRVIGPKAVPAGQPAVTRRNIGCFVGAMVMLWVGERLARPRHRRGVPLLGAHGPAHDAQLLPAAAGAAGDPGVAAAGARRQRAVLPGRACSSPSRSWPACCSTLW